MQMAIDVAGFTPAEADELRRAMGSKRSTERMERLRDRLYEGMAAQRDRRRRWPTRSSTKLAAFANFGFPESHAMSFAYLVYASAWLKRYHPAAFCAALLNAQPMGFYSPQSLVADARRHGVRVRGPDINAQRRAALEPCCSRTRDERRSGRAVRLGDWPSGAHDRRRRWPSGSTAERDARRAVPGHGRPGPARPAHRPRRLEALATADAFDCFGLARREALWAAGAAPPDRPDRLPGTAVGARRADAARHGRASRPIADVWATGLSPDSHPIRSSCRDQLGRGSALLDRPRACQPSDAGRRVLVGGVVTHRQRPATAGGITFLNLEDETGHAQRDLLAGAVAALPEGGAGSAALLVRGRLERSRRGC